MATDEYDDPIFEYDNTIETESDMEEFLLAFFYGCSEEDDYPELEGCESRTFYESGLLTANKGVVLKLANGATFQLTIVRSK